MVGEKHVSLLVVAVWVLWFAQGVMAGFDSFPRPVKNPTVPPSEDPPHSEDLEGAGSDFAISFVPDQGGATLDYNPIEATLTVKGENLFGGEVREGEFVPNRTARWALEKVFKGVKKTVGECAPNENPAFRSFEYQRMITYTANIKEGATVEGTIRLNVEATEADARLSFKPKPEKNEPQNLTDWMLNFGVDDPRFFPKITAENNVLGFGEISEGQLLFFQQSKFLKECSEPRFSSNVNDDVYPEVRNNIPTANHKGDDAVPNLNLSDATNRIIELNPELKERFSQNTALDPLLVHAPLWQRREGGLCAAIGLTAHNENTVGIYYTENGKRIEQDLFEFDFDEFKFLGDGTEAKPYPARRIDLERGKEFGLMLKSKDAEDNETTFFSEPSLNDDKRDHMLIYDLGVFDVTMFVDFGRGPEKVKLTKLHLLGFEDQACETTGNRCGDDNYNDVMLACEIEPVETIRSGPYVYGRACHDTFVLETNEVKCEITDPRTGMLKATTAKLKGAVEDGYMRVPIDFIPQFDPNHIVPSSELPGLVAILSSEQYDATRTLCESVTLGESSTAFCLSGDINADGRVDLVALVSSIRDVGLACGASAIELTAVTATGTPILGRDSIKTVLCRKDQDE